MQINQANVFITVWNQYDVPDDVMKHAKSLSPGKSWFDRRTRAYKYVNNWAQSKDNDWLVKAEKEYENSK